jgi:predicted phage-related endonuclease
MLTAEQLESRTRRIGSSDAAVLCGVENPGNRTLLDLWCTKRRGADLEFDPITPPEHPPDKAGHLGYLYADKLSPLEVGTELERAVVTMYENRTGFETELAPTVVHPEHPWAACHPDRDVVDPGDRGLECKLVGQWSTEIWGADGLPAYVVAQCQWCMACTGVDLWDACAWLNGTEARVVSVRRDDRLIATMLGLGLRFYEDNMLGNEPPPPRDGEDLIRFSGRRHPKDNGEDLALYPDPSDDDPRITEVAAIVGELQELQAEQKALKARIEEHRAKLITITGDYRGIVGPWGRWAYPTLAGRVSWKRIVEELNGGPIDDETIERHRGPPFRRAQLYPFRRK